jgi:hypothetical protein
LAGLSALAGLLSLAIVFPNAKLTYSWLLE